MSVWGGRGRKAQGWDLCPVCFEVLENVLEVGGLQQKTVQDPQYDYTLVLQMVAFCRWVCPPEIPGQRAVHGHLVGTGHWGKTVSCGFACFFLLLQREDLRQ